MKHNQVILSANGLSIGYRSKSKEILIASDLNFDLFEGELIGLVGANGIGKSTLIRTLTGVQEQLGGTVELSGRNLNEFSRIELAKTLSIVLTEGFASKNLRVDEMVKLGRQPYTNWLGSLDQNDKRSVQSAIELTGIEDYLNKRCYELSDGQLQKVLIARALAQDTDIIVLDEPTTHLDLYHRAYILSTLQRLSSTLGKTVLFSTHEIELAIQLCDRLLLMTETEVVLDTPEGHIGTGRFDALFPKELVSFDRMNRTFRINKKE